MYVYIYKYIYIYILSYILCVYMQHIKPIISCIRWRLYNIWNELLLIAECEGHPVTLLAPSGTFGIDKNEYKSNLLCQWKIVVEADKVSIACIKYNASKLFNIISTVVAVCIKNDVVNTYQSYVWRNICSPGNA